MGKDGKPEGVRFTLGSTGPVLQGLGAIESDIYMEGDKISTILREHPEMTLAEIKKIPQLLEDPALVLKSKTRGGTSNTRLVLLDTAKAKNGRNIVAVLDLRPVEKGFAIDDIQKVSSAYTKTATENRTAKENRRGFLKTSDVLFLDKKRATSLLKTMGFSMPIELHRNGYVGSISYFKQNVNIKGLPFSFVVQEGDVQFAIREIGGKVMPVLDTQKDTRDYSAAEAYLKTLVDTEHPFSTILMDAQPVYIGRDLPGEYKGSDYTYGLNRAMRQVKMQAATNLDEMLLLAENGEWRENIKEKHKVDAKNGWYRYSTQFAVPVLDIKKTVDHYTVYSGTLLIRNDADGKSYLYDLLDIKKEKVISTSSFSARGHSEVLAPKPSQAQYTQDQTESQAQIRSSTLSDRDVLRIAAQMAKNSESMLDIKKNHPASSLFRAYNSVPAASAEWLYWQYNLCWAECQHQGLAFFLRGGGRGRAVLPARQRRSELDGGAAGLLQGQQGAGCSSSWCPRSAYRNWPASMQNGKNDWQYWMTYIQDKNDTVWEATLNVAESANGVKYLYDISPIKKVGQSVKSDTSTTSVGQSVKSDTSTTTDIVAQNQTESQAQIRCLTLSDRDVLRIAAQMAKNSESRSLTDGDRSAPLNFGYHEAKHLIQSCFIQIETVSVLQCVLPCFLFRISIFNHQRHRTGKYTNSEERSICGNEKFFPVKINRAVFCREGSFHFG